MECKCGTGDISKMALDHKINEKYVLSSPRKLVSLLLFSGSTRQQLLCAYFK